MFIFAPTMNERNDILDLLEKLPPIYLDEMASIRLMNRMDTKFLTDIPTLKRLLEMANGSYFVQQIGDKRISAYTTTYFDTPEGHEMFRTHHCGHAPRTKVRVRTYMDSGDVFLEVKRKNNHGKTKKKRVSVPSLDAVMKGRVEENFLREYSGYSYDDIIPALSNRFQRITLVNTGKTERLTIDFNLVFHNHETGREAAMENIVIIELKRDGRVVSPILPMLRLLRIKPAGFSKYCIGTAITHPDLPQNRFKKRLVKIRKVAGTYETGDNLF